MGFVVNRCFVFALISFTRVNDHKQIEISFTNFSFLSYLKCFTVTLIELTYLGICLDKQLFSFTRHLAISRAVEMVAILDQEFVRILTKIATNQDCFEATTIVTVIASAVIVEFTTVVTSCCRGAMGLKGSNLKHRLIRHRSVPKCFLRVLPTSVNLGFIALNRASDQIEPVVFRVKLRHRSENGVDQSVPSYYQVEFAGVTRTSYRHFDGKGGLINLPLFARIRHSQYPVTKYATHVILG